MDVYNLHVIFIIGKVQSERKLKGFFYFLVFDTATGANRSINFLSENFFSFLLSATLWIVLKNTPLVGGRRWWCYLKSSFSPVKLGRCWRGSLQDENFSGSGAWVGWAGDCEIKSGHYRAQRHHFASTNKMFNLLLFTFPVRFSLFPRLYLEHSWSNNSKRSGVE